MKNTYTGVLKHLALLGAVTDFVELSSQELATLIDASQQTSSRLLIELEDAGMIRRRMGVKKQQLQLTENGVERLRQEYADYQRIFDMGDTLHIAGVLVTGFGEGQYYVSKDGYMDQFIEKLGFTPYPGTLNLEIHSLELNKLRMLRNAEGIVLDEFVAEGRTFGSVRCLRCTIRHLEGAILFPLRSHHANVLEIISPHALRQELSLADGDTVEIAITLKQ